MTIIGIIIRRMRTWDWPGSPEEEVFHRVVRRLAVIIWIRY